MLSGPSGAGKSLLLRAIADLDPARGRLRLDGRERGDFSGPEWRRQVGLGPAESGWWAEKVGPHFLPDPDPAPLLARLGLGAALEWQVARLSTGERQRLALARAIQLGPRALLLDEPTSALDPQAVDVTEALIRAQAEAGLIVLVVSHDRAQQARLGDRRLRLENGALHQEDAP